VLLVVIWEIFKLSPNCPQGDICQLAGQKLQLTGKVVSLPSERLERTIIEISVQDYQGFKGKTQVTLPHTRYGFQYGDQIILEGKLKLPDRDSGENFSYPLYLAGKEVYSVMYYPNVILCKNVGFCPPAPQAGVFTEKNYQDELYEKILNLREKIRCVINSHLTEPDSSIMNAMIIGDQGSVPQETRRELSRVGIIHILSVSGAHVTLVIAIMTFILTKITYRHSIIFFFASAGVIFYLLIAGSPNCASRSAIMGLLAFLSLFKGRSFSLKTALWLSAAVLLSLNPAAIFADVGFDLSFLAVLGMAYIYPSFDKSLTWGRPGFWWKTLRLLLLSVSISLTTVPLVYYYFGIISWISPAANLVLLPLFSTVLPAGFLLAGLGFSTDIISSFLALSIHYLLYFTEYLTKLFLRIPGSYFEGVVGLSWIALYYILLFLLVFIFHFVVKKHIFPRRLDYFGSEKFLSNHVETQNFASPQKRIKKRYRNLASIYSENKLRGSIFSLSLLGAGCLLLVSSSYLYLSSRPPRLVALNVGQGDAILLDWPEHHLQILIDGGPGRNILPELGKALPFYDRKIEMLVLSHPHQDHIEGLIGVSDRYKISQVILPSLSQSNAGALARQPAKQASLQNIFWEKLIGKKVPVSISERNQKFYLNEGNENLASFRFLTPLFDYSKYSLINLNNSSAVLEMSYPKRILFMGDAQSNLEKILLTKESHNMQFEVLKVGHHGSRFSSSDEFLDAVQPKIALINVGKGNLYGHPAADTIKKLERRNVEFFRTDKDGRIVINL